MALLVRELLRFHHTGSISPLSMARLSGSVSSSATYWLCDLEKFTYTLHILNSLKIK